MSSSVITTVNEKLQRIQDIITLESCKGNTAERELKINRLMAVEDPEILNYILVHHAIPYKKYMETRIESEQRYRVKGETEPNDTIPFAEFWHRFGEIMDYRNRRDSQEGIIRYLWLEAFAIPNKEDWKESLVVKGIPKEHY